MVDITQDLLLKLGYLAPFATEVAHRYLTEVGFEDADALHRVLSDLFATADFSPDDSDIFRAYSNLPDAEREVLSKLVETTSLLSEFSSQRDVAFELDYALTFHWPTSFGFESRGDAVSKLGRDVADKIDAFVDAKSENFWFRDNLAAQLDAKELSASDMRLVSAYGFTDSDGRILNAVALFSDTEALRRDLQNGALKLPPDAVAFLEIGLNRCLKKFRPGTDPVSLDGWLT